MKPLIAKWRRQEALVVVFYHDGMAVSDSFSIRIIKDLSRQMLCDLLGAGLVPVVNKCIWQPRKIIERNSLKFDYGQKTLSIMNHRVKKLLIPFKSC